MGCEGGHSIGMGPSGFRILGAREILWTILGRLVLGLDAVALGGEEDGEMLAWGLMRVGGG